MTDLKSDADQLVFEYVNWKGDKAVRRVKPLEIWYGHTEWHPDDGWLLKAVDLDKNAERNFAVKDIVKWL